MKNLSHILIILGPLLLLAACATQPEPSRTAAPTPTQRPLLLPTDLPVDYQIEVVVDPAHFPVALAFLPEGGFLYTRDQQGTVIWVDAEGILREPPVLSVPLGDFDPNAAENVLTGIALDPAFEDNRHVWVNYTQPLSAAPDEGLVNKILRFEMLDGLAQNVTTMLTIPIASGDIDHREGNLAFDADGYLYLSIGDTGEPDRTQDPDALAGRIHRFEVADDELQPAPDNPFANNSTFAYGLRNAFDFTFDPFNDNTLLATVNGPDCDDKIAPILAGSNHGWREGYPCDAADPQDAATFTYPFYWLNPPEGITGIMVYDGEMFPEWQGDIFFCAFNAGRLRRLSLDRDLMVTTAVRRVYLPQGVGCQLDVAQAPDGSIYFSDLGRIFRLYRAL